MDPKPIVLDISSDEEEDANWVNDDVIRGISDDDHNWITELLNEVNGDGGGNGGGDVSDGSDDVVVVSEVVVAKKNNRRKVNNRECLGLDDDCVILECDPDKSIVTRNDDPVGDDDGDEDDLVVVSEKGQVACRDYPHSRHLCIKFPFASTPNQSHCDQCYCYVCDSLAPCIYWGNGGSYLDHCQATDKDDFWKLERQNSKNPVTPALPTSLVPPTVANPNRILPTFSVPSLATPTYPVLPTPPPTYPAPPPLPTYPVPPPLPTYPVPPPPPPPPPTYPVPPTPPPTNNQVSSMNPVTSCSISSGFRVPSIINQNQVSLLSSRNKFQPGLVSQQLTRTSSCNNHNLNTPLHKPVFKRTFSASFVAPTTGSHGSNRLFMENDTNLFRPSSSQPDFISTSVPFSQPNLAYEDIQPKSNNQIDFSTNFQPSVNSVPFTTTPSFQLQGQSSLPTYLTPVASQQVNQIQSQSKSAVDPKFFNDISWPQSQTAHQPVTQSSTLEGTSPTNASSHANGYGGAVNYDNDNYSWMFNNQQPETIRDPGPFGLSQFSPEPTYIDSGTNFEF